LEALPFMEKWDIWDVLGWLFVCFLKFVWSMGFVDGFSMVYYSWSCGMLFVIDAFCGWW